VEIKQGFFGFPPTVHNLREGETLSKLAYKFLGDSGAWRRIAELNNIEDPRRVFPGLALLIPPNMTSTRK
jgi:nucleoid-associated protein YgaU